MGTRLPHLFQLSYWRYLLHVWRYGLAEKILWKIAWLIPRKLALIVFVRVSSADPDGPGMEYERAYRAWEAGAGR